MGYHAIGPLKVLAREQRTFKIQRGAVVERVNSDHLTRALTLGEKRKSDAETIEATHIDVVSKRTETGSVDS